MSADGPFKGGESRRTHRDENLCLEDLGRRARHNVAVPNDKVGPLARLERARVLLSERRMSRIESHALEGLRARQPLGREPSSGPMRRLAALVEPRHGCVEALERIDALDWKIRAEGDLAPAVEDGPPGIVAPAVHPVRAELGEDVAHVGRRVRRLIACDHAQVDDPVEVRGRQELGVFDPESAVGRGREMRRKGVEDDRVRAVADSMDVLKKGGSTAGCCQSLQCGGYLYRQSEESLRRDARPASRARPSC